MTHNHSLFRSLCTQRWTRACSLSPEAPSFWLAFQARPALCIHVFVKVQCSSLGSTLEDKCFSVFSTDWRWQWWRTSNSAVAAFIAKRPRVAYSCSYVLLLVAIARFCHSTAKLALCGEQRPLAQSPAMGDGGRAPLKSWMLAGVGLRPRPLRLCSSRSPHHDLNLKARKRIELHVSGMARMCASLDSDGLTGRSTFAPTATSPSRRMNGPVCENFTVSVTSFTDGAFSSCGFSVTFTAGMNRRFSHVTWLFV